MKVSEINQLTLNEIQQLTSRDLELDVLEILKRYEKSELPLTPNMLKKLNELAGLLPEEKRSLISKLKTISEFVRFAYSTIELLEKLGAIDKFNKGLELIRQAFP